MKDIVRWFHILSNLKVSHTSLLSEMEFFGCKTDTRHARQVLSCVLYWNTSKMIFSGKSILLELSSMIMTMILATFRHMLKVTILVKKFGEHDQWKFVLYLGFVLHLCLASCIEETVSRAYHPIIKLKSSRPVDRPRYPVFPKPISSRKVTDV